jgi:hypothetical protein
VKKLPLVFLQQNVGTLIEWDRICWIQLVVTHDLFVLRY